MQQRHKSKTLVLLIKINQKSKNLKSCTKINYNHRHVLNVNSALSFINFILQLYNLEIIGNCVAHH